MANFKKILPVISNRYFLVGLGFAIWMLFFDQRDFFQQKERAGELNKLEAAKKYYQDEITKTKKQLDNLQNNPAAIEKFDRERYLLKREGATVVIEVSPTEEELVRAVANEWFDVIGISVAIESQLLSLKSLVQALKKNSGNPDVKVLLGGPIFMLVNVTAAMFDADVISNNAQEVVALLKNFSAK